MCPGSYDPITLGHLDIIARASALYDEVVVAVLHNPAKQGLFTPAERLSMIVDEMDAAGLENVTAVAFANRLLVDVCSELGARAIVKGLRGETDYSYELPMAVMNRHLTGVETLFLPGEPSYSQVSSSLMKEVAKFGGDVSGLVSDRVRTAMIERLNGGARPAAEGAVESAAGGSAEGADGDRG